MFLFGVVSAHVSVCIAFSGSGRSGRLRSIRCPALVIHGTVDPLIPVECGRATARAIPGSVLMEIQGMGHELPPVLFETLAQNIANNARRRFLPSSSLDSDLQVFFFRQTSTFEQCSRIVLHSICRSCIFPRQAARNHVLDVAKFFHFSRRNGSVAAVGAYAAFHALSSPWMM